MNEEVGEVAGPANDVRRDWIEFVRVRLAADSCVLELGRVERLVDAPEITRVPRSSPAIVGITAVGSDIAPVVEGRTILGLPPRPAEHDPTLILLDRGGEARAAGLLVDEVVGIETHHVDRVTPVAENEDWTSQIDRQWFRAVVAPDSDDRPLGVLDVGTALEAVADRSHSP